MTHDGNEAGVVTSVSPVVTDGRSLALGLRKRKFEEIGELAVDGGSARVVKRL